MIKRLKMLKNTVNKYMADIRPDRLTTCQSERKSDVSRRPSILASQRKLRWLVQHCFNFIIHWSFLIPICSPSSISVVK
jgi:hypothetical protein